MPGDADQTLFVYSTEPGSRSAAGLDVLASWIAQPSPDGRAAPDPRAA